MIVREDAVLCGRDWFDGTVHALDAAARIAWQAGRRTREGGATLCEIEADARALLSAERPALNFLQLLSATATLTRRHVDAIAGASPNKRLRHPRHPQDPPRAAPGAEVRGARGRRAQPAPRAVARHPGGRTTSPRPAASPQVLAQARALNAGVEIQIEVETLAQLKEALECGATSVLLDNFELTAMRGRGAERRARRAGGIGRRAARAVARHRRHRRGPHLGGRADQERRRSICRCASSRRSEQRRASGAIRSIQRRARPTLRAMSADFTSIQNFHRACAVFEAVEAARSASRNSPRPSCWPTSPAWR